MTDYRNATVDISRLAITSDIIDGASFANCLVVGPAVLVPLDGSSFVGCQFDGSVEGLFWVLEPHRPEVIGAIGLRNCAFHDCRFQRIGIASRSEDIASMLEGFWVEPAEAQP